MRYIKRMSMPKTWPLPRKGTTYVASPLPGRKLELNMPLVLIVKKLGFARTSREVQFMINSERIKVNSKKVRSKSTPIGLFDVVSFPSIKKSFRLLLNNKKLHLINITESDAKIRPAKIIGKSSLLKGKLQINLDNGNNFITKEKYGAGDTVVFDLEKNSISNHLKFEEGNLAYLLGGRYLGETVKIIKIEEGKIVCKLKDKETNVERKFLFIIGKDKSIVTLNENE